MATAATLLLAPAAHAGERYPSGDRQERSWPEQPHYLPSWERTQRGYLPSYQYELERRKLCGSFCDDVTRRRRDPFER
jgi:hypothetical protein